jgi:hypothetical protein
VDAAWRSTSIDGSVLLFAAAVSVAAALLFAPRPRCELPRGLWIRPTAGQRGRWPRAPLVCDSFVVARSRFLVLLAAATMSSDLAQLEAQILDSAGTIDSWCSTREPGYRPDPGTLIPRLSNAWKPSRSRGGKRCRVRRSQAEAG